MSTDSGGSGKFPEVVFLKRGKNPGEINYQDKKRGMMF